MRRFIITALILILSSSAHAEENGTTSMTGSISPDLADGPHGEPPRADVGPETSGAKPPSSSGSWYIAPTAGITMVASRSTFEAGLRGSWRFHRRFGLGLAAYSWAGGPSVDGRGVEGGYGGFMFEYVFNPGHAFQVATASVLGGGAYCTDDIRGSCTKPKEFFATDATLNLEHQIFDHVRIAVGAGYRF